MAASEIETAIRAALGSYLENPAALGLTTDLAVVAEALDALPVYADIGGPMLIRPSGGVLIVHSNQEWDAAASYRVHDDPYWRGMALVSLAYQFPSLCAVAERLRAGI